MPIVGNPRTFDRRFAFKLVIDGFLSADFSKVGPLAAKISKVTYREGGKIIPNKSLGLVDFDPITCERGVTSIDQDVYLWFLQAANAAANIGLKDQIVKRHADILQLDRDGEIIGRWSVFNAFPTEWTGGEWDASANEVVVSKLVLEYDYVVKTL